MSGSGAPFRNPTPSTAPTISRRLPVGAELIAPGRVQFRVWAPPARSMEVVVNEQAAVQLARDEAGYWSVEADAVAGDLYQFRIDNGERGYPDPASRFQPRGPHGPSQIVDPAAFAWTDAGWAGVSIEGQIIYELHIGTFTPERTWLAASRELPALADLGITAVEVMPIAEFDGEFGWGYDGVNMFAPFHHYGSPDDVRAFVDEAHRVGIGVILDVVYNHLGPSGNYLRQFSPAYFSKTYDNEWGDALNFDDPDSGPVREFFLANAGYWIDEFHMDGLRLDATQQIFDASPRHLVAEVGAEMRRAARGRAVFAVAENEPQQTDLVRPESAGGMGIDGLWNDDFHHSAMVALTGRAEAYYTDTAGTPQEFIAAAKFGYLFQGQYYSWQRHPRGTPGLDLDPARFVVYLQNHDQVANSVHGARMHQVGTPARVRALTALTLLMPGTPMLFQGQEFAASAPFLYFAHHEPQLADAVRRGRAEFLTQFPSARAYEHVAGLDDPADRRTFERCTLDRREWQAHAPVVALHRDLLRLRRHTPAFRAQRRGGVDGAVLAEGAFALRYTMGGADDRLLIVNLGRDVNRPSFAEPLVAPPRGCEWIIEWSSDDPAYGGIGMPDLWPGDRWLIPADAAVVLKPAPAAPAAPASRKVLA
ncbi:MAG TPA: malto-oligosyltrehalose trehalohydrolase [Vicinamibacterales bacterium]|nr:malto-oligosyltrehalose trehalohydrolase [Vicinamibacterales bacterium]